MYKKDKRGILYWITGLSGAGKTTIGNTLYYQLKKKYDCVILLDGDILKQITDENLGYSIDDRKKRAIKYSKLCKTLVDQGMIVICCTIAMFDAVRRWNRINIDGYVEVFLNVPMDILMKRDKKGMYTGIKERKFSNLVGVDIDTEFPKQPDISIINDGTLSVKQCVEMILNVEVKYKKYFNRDTSYWNNFYKQKLLINEPTQFAQDILPFLKQNKRILDLGCGNGRDSIFFMEHKLFVTGVDASSSAISILNEKYEQDNRAIFICDDFIKSKSLYQQQYDYCYSRFTMHAINKQQQDELLDNIYQCLKKDGKFFIETRCIKDELYGKGKAVEKDAFIYNDHYRRFIDKEELENELQEKGFLIEQSIEDKDFAKFGDNNPIVLRIIASKKNEIFL